MDDKNYILLLQKTRENLFAELYLWTHEEQAPKGTYNVTTKIHEAIVAVEDLIDVLKKQQEPSPMMKQFLGLKAKHPDALLLFRCGDFYETYCEDAVTASRILGITLTKRNNGYNKGDEMAGFPHHALDTYLPKLIRAGKRVAICDQLEEPKKTVKRGITELITPATL